MREFLSIGTLFALILVAAACAPAGGPEDQGSISFQTDTLTVTEGDIAVLTVERSGGFAGDASVAYATTERSATEGTDYEAKSGTLYWVDGDETVETIDIETFVDNVAEGQESFLVTLTEPRGTELGTFPQVTVTIEDPVEGPRVLSTIPRDGAEDVNLNRSIQVTFSEAMNRDMTEAAFSAGPSAGPDVTCAFRWNSASTTLTCDPEGGLDASSSYQVTVDTGARSSAGVSLPSDYSFAFQTGTEEDTTAPFVVDTTPDDGASDVALNTDISVLFSEEMDQASAEGAFTASPAVDCSFNWNTAGDRLTCDTDLTANTTYTITIDTSAEDTAGNALATTETFTFTTGETTLSACVFGSGTFGTCVFGP